MYDGIKSEGDVLMEDSTKGRDRILIVDDMPANIRILGQLLRDRYDVRVATSGEKALAIAGSDPPPRFGAPGYHDAGHGWV